MIDWRWKWLMIALVSFSGMVGCGDEDRGSGSGAGTQDAAIPEDAVATYDASQDAAYQQDAASEAGEDVVSSQEAAPEPFVLSSPAFDPDGPMSLPHVCTSYTDLGISPELVWSNPPADTLSYALTSIDIDGGNWVHWMAWGIDGASLGLEEGIPSQGDTGEILQGINGFGDPGYGGPCPPPNGVHRYVFTLYALDTNDVSSLDPESTKLKDLQSFIDDHLLDSATVIGTYERP